MWWAGKVREGAWPLHVLEAGSLPHLMRCALAGREWGWSSGVVAWRWVRGWFLTSGLELGSSVDVLITPCCDVFLPDINEH